MPSIEEIKNQVTKCTNCQLCETRTNAVPGKGNLHSKVIFVGEAPGRSEDKNGEPFVGAAGKKLTAALESAGIAREDIYITNVVKCRPPNNRIPSTGEREACSNYLESEIKEINPKIICIMGNTAYGSILGGNNITKNRGRIVEHLGNRYFITIHPAATIYNHELLDVLKKDMKKIASIIKK